MKFLTEDDIRARSPQRGGVLSLARDERLTPSAAEYAAGLHLAVAGREAAAPEAFRPVLHAEETARPAEVPCGHTRLNAETVVPKTHPRIILRGRLDSLLASTVLVQTRFDPKRRLPPLPADCLADVRNWILQILAAEVAGTEPEITGMGGMDMETLHTVSREPAKYLGIDHRMAEASQGGDAALINRLRAEAREVEIEALRALPCDSPICGALNRLGSALYVLMLLVMSGGAQAPKERGGK